MWYEKCWWWPKNIMPITVLFSIILILIRRGSLVMFSLPALCLRGEFCDLLLVDAADLPGPLWAFGAGGVAWGLILALLLHLSPTLSHIILGKKDFFRELYKCELSCSFGYMNLSDKRRAQFILKFLESFALYCYVLYVVYIVQVYFWKIHWKTLRQCFL